MSAGPILIFDKSLMEMLSPDEAVWLGQFYRVNIVPVFLVEKRQGWLYYLPFCMVFASMDKLHAKTVPVFLRG
jgi:hypothetical protein